MTAFPAGLAQWWCDGFWSVYWQVGLAAAVAGTFTGALRRLSPSVRSWIWRAVHLKVFVLLLWPLPIELPLSTPTLGMTAVGEGPTGASSAVSMTPLLLFSLWAAGVVVIALRHRRGWRALARLRATATARRDPRVERACAALGLHRPLAVVSVAGLGSPFVCGLRRPVLVLPADLGLSDRRMAALLAHEVAHVLRRDVLWGGIMAAARTLLWCQPLIWWAGRRAAAAAELACDATALRAADVSPTDLGATLVLVAARPPHGPGATPAMASKDAAELQRRLLALRAPDSSSPRSLVAAALVALALLAPVKLVGRTGGASHPPSVAATESARVWLFRNRGGAVLRVILRPAPEGGLLASVERRPHGGSAELRVADLDELRTRDDEAWRLVQSSVRPTAKRDWLFHPAAGDRDT